MRLRLVACVEMDRMLRFRTNAAFVPNDVPVNGHVHGARMVTGCVRLDVAHVEHDGVRRAALGV